MTNGKVTLLPSSQVAAETNIQSCNANTQWAYILTVARTPTGALPLLHLLHSQEDASSNLTFSTESLRGQARPQLSSCCCLQKEAPHYWLCTLSYFLFSPGGVLLAISWPSLIKRLRLLGQLRSLRDGRRINVRPARSVLRRYSGRDSHAPRVVIVQEAE